LRIRSGHSRVSPVNGDLGLATLRWQRSAEEGDDVHGVLERAGAGLAAGKPMSLDPPGGPDSARRWHGLDSTGGLPVTGEPPEPGHGLSPQARRRWYSAIGATAALALLAGGVVTLVPRHRHTITQLAADCGLIHCDATLPGAIVTSSPSGHVSTPQPHHRARKSASPSPSASTSHRATPAASAPPTQAPSPAPTPAKPTPTPPPGPKVGVTYTLDSQDNHWGENHFHGHLTVVNHGSQQVSGWTIQLALAGDRIRWVGYRQGWSLVPFASWGYSGSTLTLSASFAGETLGPGASQTVYIDADGNAVSPSGCSFDGAACHS
jgi:cell division septation protein DedD